MTSTRRVQRACLAVVLAVLAVFGGVVLSTTPDCGDHCQTLTAAPVPQVAPRPSPIVPASLAILPPAGATDVSPTARILVTANSGILDTVALVNDAGKAIPGVMTPDAKTWKPTSQLGYGRTYTLTIAARGPGGMPSRQTSSFSTLTPSNQTEVYLETTAGGLLQDGATYGVGAVVVAKFDEPIANKANAERHLVVTTNPPVLGSWNWIDDQTAHWRPEKYYAPGTSVDVTASLYGVPVGDGLYGQEDEHVSFKIGDSHVSIADDTTKQVSVFENGKLVRTMPTSMGMGGTETIGGHHAELLDPAGCLHRHGQGQPGDHGLVHLRAADQLPPRISRDHPVGHPHQHGRHLPAPTQRDGVGAGQHRHQPRLPEPQRRERQMVLRLLRARRCRRGAQHRRPAVESVAERRLDGAVGRVA